MKPKRAKPFSASLASRKRLERDGWTVGCVESRIPHTFITRDLWNFADLICMAPSRGIMLVQATGGTSTENFNARVAKLRSTAEVGIWLASGGRIQVHGWQSAGEPVGELFRGRWCRVLEVTKQ